MGGRAAVARARRHRVAAARPHRVRWRHDAWHRRPGPAISLAVLPFRNASGDPTLDSLGASLSQVLGSELGQSSRVRTVPADRLHQVLRDLQIASNATLAPTELVRVADFTNARRVLWGQISRFGDAVRIDATLQDLDRNASVPLTATAPNEASFLTAISTLADAVRQELARGTPDILTELKATAWKPSTSSFEAMRLYSEGMQLTQQGTHQEALKRFEAATKQDGNFALAYSALGRTYASLGYDNEAMQASRRAMSLADALPAQEKYLIAANHYRTRERHRQGDRVVRESRQGVAQQRDGPVRSGRPVRTERETRPGARTLRQGRRARPEVRRGSAGARPDRDQATPAPGCARAPQRRAGVGGPTQQRGSPVQYSPRDRGRVSAPEPAGGSAAAVRAVARNQATAQRQARHGEHAR